MIKRTVRGVGYNSGGIYKRTEHGKITDCYHVWKGMFDRCYSDYQLERRPTYIGCSVDEAFHDYQDFAKWYYENKYSGLGYELDKDILITGNKVYSPENCCLVPKQINMMFTNTNRSRGKYPQGVNYHKPLDKFCARICMHGKPKYLGYFETPELAHLAFKKEKERHVKEVADLWFGNIDTKVYEALMDWELD